jgi:ribosomal protein S12 methylthiotransferase accessory factor
MMASASFVSAFGLPIRSSLISGPSQAKTPLAASAARTVTPDPSGLLRWRRSKPLDSLVAREYCSRVSMPHRSRSKTKEVPGQLVRPIVFVGPSMPHEEARRIFADAEYRAPIRRGELDAVPNDAVVGVIDGYFEPALAIAPAEVERAIERGVFILGSSSIGAVLASRVPKMRGVGLVYELYRDALADSEIQCVFDPETFRRTTCTLVSIRVGVDKLVRTGTIDGELGARVLKAANELTHANRSYEEVVRRAGLSDRPDSKDLIRMLASINVEREDAQLLLEHALTLVLDRAAPEDDNSPRWFRGPVSGTPGASVLVWDYGQSINFDDLLFFLKVTGEFDHHARHAVARSVLAGRGDVIAPVTSHHDVSLPTRKDLLDTIWSNWGFVTSLDTKRTLRELGFELTDLRKHLDDEVSAIRTVSEAALNSSEFNSAMRAELLMHELALKRAVMRFASAEYFARRGQSDGMPLSDAERDDAEYALGLANGVVTPEQLRDCVLRRGIKLEQLERTIESVAFARRGAAEVQSSLWGLRPTRVKPALIPERLRKKLGLTSNRKAKGTRRFLLPMARASTIAATIAESIGIVSVSVLSDNRLGVEISIARRPTAATSWSNTAGSGKSLTEAGARVGGILEEAEKFAQDHYVCRQTIVASYEQLRERTPVIDPRTLDLPSDSRYRPNLEIQWASSLDLLGKNEVLVPVAALVSGRLVHDIFYSARYGEKFFSTNGLASGFSAAEALLHATCEIIERHATCLAEVRISHPGRLGPIDDLRFVDHSTLPISNQRLIEQYRHAGYRTKVLNITSEIKVPTFWAHVYPNDDTRIGQGKFWPGYGTHPDPEVAIEMALFEAAQLATGSDAIAENAIKPRSLGRHERPRPATVDDNIFWFGDLAPTVNYQTIHGFFDRDILAELEWVLGCVRDAGFEHVIACDITHSAIRPGAVFRVIIPGTETINPFHVGPRARAHGLRNLLYPRRRGTHT